MVAQALTRSRAQEQTACAQAKSLPSAWLYGRLRYAASEGVPKPTLLHARVRESWRRLWYGRLDQPRTSDESRVVLPDFRLVCGSREQAREKCRDKYDFIVALPYGDTPLGDDIQSSPTFCRPLWRPHRAKDVLDSKIYVESLESRLCADLSALREEIGLLKNAAKV